MSKGFFPSLFSFQGDLGHAGQWHIIEGHIRLSGKRGTEGVPVLPPAQKPQSLMMWLRGYCFHRLQKPIRGEKK